MHCFPLSKKLKERREKMMKPSFPAKILIGIPLDPDVSKDLLSWAITILARPNDDIIALHVLVGDETKKQKMRKRRQEQIRQAKAHVISMLGEFSGTCQSKQINLEAKVGFSSGISKGLIDEAKSISADYLLLRGLRSKSNRSWHDALMYCFKHAPEGCSVISIGKSQQNPQEISDSESSISSTNKKEDINIPNPSPPTVLDELDEESITTSTSFESSITTTESSATPSKSRKQEHASKILSFFSSPLRRRNLCFSNTGRKQQPLLKCFSYEEIATATNNFHTDNIVGRGGYSEVYRGDLCDGRKIAVKRIAMDNKDGTKEKEFLTELGILGHVCHPNTATLVGCCIENGLYLIFDFSQNGNLASALHGKSSNPLEWEVRYKIVLGVARGLHYLHKCCKRRIIHRDIKASNVLLGPDYEPQITDFGLAKWLPNKWTHHAVIPIEGTFGYLAPEYFMHGTVDEKTDVFAFGVLLLEIISGRRPVDSSKQNLLLWAKPLMESGKITELADPKLQGNYNEDEMYRVVLTASYCVRQSSIWRPSMSEVLELLTDGNDSQAARSWRMPKFTSDELDDYSMVFGYEVPIDIALEDYL